MLGVRPELLRMWEKRYHLFKPQRAGNRYREFDDEDVQLLQLSVLPSVPFYGDSVSTEPGNNVSKSGGDVYRGYNMRILIVEDEWKTSAYLRKGLSENGFVVDVAGQGEDGLHCTCTGNYDLIILDIMLPARDGWSVLTEMRRRGMHTPVLFLTARDALQDRVKGLELGADDYLVKPFAFSELLARVRSILRRSPMQQPAILRIADLEIDLLRYKVTREGTCLELTPKEFALLSLMSRHTGEVLSRTLIAEQVWDMNFTSDTNVVDVAVRRLRKKVDDPFTQKLIHTVLGVGYVLEDR
jgi:two-component system copper resistance phosphate regulon response regulator CusR